MQPQLQKRDRCYVVGIRNLIDVTARANKNSRTMPFHHNPESRLIPFNPREPKIGIRQLFAQTQVPFVRFAPTIACTLDKKLCCSEREMEPFTNDWTLLSKAAAKHGDRH
jgi:hypothetical protein